MLQQVIQLHLKWISLQNIVGTETKLQAKGCNLQVDGGDQLYTIQSYEMS